MIKKTPIYYVVGFSPKMKQLKFVINIQKTNHRALTGSTQIIVDSDISSRVFFLFYYENSILNYLLSVHQKTGAKY